jgi:molybdate-binding protein
MTAGSDHDCDAQLGRKTIRGVGRLAPPGRNVGSGPAGRIDCGIATRSVARTAGLDFLPLTWERFDLVLWQRDYFMKGPQALFGFMRASILGDRAAELGGYDVSDAGVVRLVN